MDKILVKTAILILFLGSFFLILGNVQRIISSTAPDFSVLWISARDLTLKLNPYLDTSAYTPNGYPPVSLIFYIPLSLLPFQVAQAIFTLISFAAIVGAVYLAIKIATRRVDWPMFLMFLALAFLSFPTKFSLGMGQVNMIVLFLLLLTVFLVSKKKSIISGVLLGISICLKPIFAFFLLYFVLKKSWKTILAAMLTGLIFAISTVIFWPISYWFSWLKIGILPLGNLAGREVYYNQGLMGFIARIFTNLTVREYLSGVASVILVIMTSFFALKRKSENLILSLFIITLLLIDSLSWQHHFVWLIFPFVVLTSIATELKNAVFVGLLIIAFVLVSWNFKEPFSTPTILLSNQFYGTLILLGINLWMLRYTNERRKAIYS